MGTPDPQRDFPACYDAALRYLAYRPRSEAELTRRLSGRGFPPEAIRGTLLRLREQHLLDDGEFARYWVEQRQSFRPRGRRLLQRELRQKGVEPGAIAEALEPLDEGQAATAAARRYLPRLVGADYPTYARRLAAHLLRRGFPYEVIQETVARLWREHSGGDPSPDL